MAEPRAQMPPDVQFLVTIANGELVADSVQFGPGPVVAPTHDTYAVLVDTASHVTVWQQVNGQPQITATARWIANIKTLADVQHAGGTTNMVAMMQIQTAIGRAFLRRGKVGQATKRAAPEKPKQKRGFWKLVGSAIAGVFLVAGVLTWECIKQDIDKRPNGEKCDFDRQCASDNCARELGGPRRCRASYHHSLKNGSRCLDNDECKSGFCNAQHACVGR